MPANRKFNAMPQPVRPPCAKDCKNRSPGCGATCEAWQEYTKLRNAIYRQRILNSDRYEYTKRGIKEVEKAARKHK